MTRGTLTATALTAVLLTACTGGGGSSEATDPPAAKTATETEMMTVTGGVEHPTSSPATDAETDAAAATTAGPPPPPPTATLTWRSDVEPLSGPVLVDGVLVLYTRDGEQMALTAVDPGSGEVVWSHPATPSRALAGVGIRVERVGADRVVHLEPAEEGADDLVDSRVVVREAATGEVLVRMDEDSSHYRLPRGCQVPEGEICLSLRAGDLHRPLQVLNDDGSVGHIAQTVDAMHYNGPLGPAGLGRMTGQEIGMVVDGELVWSTRTDEVFGPGASTNSGWTFQAVEDDSLLVGSVGPVDDPRINHEIDLRDYAVAALDAETGERRWLSEATSLFCDAHLGLEEDPLLACRYAAGVMRLEDGEADYSDVEVSLVRLDPRTGETLWELALSSPPEEARPEVSPLDEEHVIVTGLTVDVEDGSARPSTSSETAWEEDGATVEVSPPHLGSMKIYPSSTWLLPEGATLDGLGDGPRWPLPPGVGVEVDEARVVTVDGQLVRWDAP